LKKMKCYKIIQQIMLSNRNEINFFKTLTLTTELDLNQIFEYFLVYMLYMSKNVIRHDEI